MPEITLSAEVKAELKTITDQQVKIAGEMETSKKALDEAVKKFEGTADIKQALEKQVKDMGTKADEAKALTEKIKTDLNKRVDEFEAKVQSGGFGGERMVKTIGELVTESEAYKSRKNRDNTARIELKTSFFQKDTLTTGATSGGAAIVPFRVPGIIQPVPEQSLRIRDILNVTPIGVGSLEYVREDVFDDGSSGNDNRGNATVVAEEGTKPESRIQFSLQTATATVIATTLPITEQITDDAPVLVGYVNGRLIYALKIEEEDEVLYGDGTGAHLPGITTVAAEYTGSYAGNTVDVLRRAITQVQLAHFPATGFVLNPADWEAIELTKVGGSDVRYLFADPQNRATPRLWGLPVVESESLLAGDFLCGSFGLASTLYDRQVANIQIGWVNAQFAQNMKTIRAEERLMLVTFRPNAFVYDSLASAS